MEKEKKKSIFAIVLAVVFVILLVATVVVTRQINKLMNQRRKETRLAEQIAQDKKVTDTTFTYKVLYNELQNFQLDIDLRVDAPELVGIGLWARSPIYQGTMGLKINSNEMSVSFLHETLHPSSDYREDKELERKTAEAGGLFSDIYYPSTPLYFKDAIKHTSNYKIDIIDKSGYRICLFNKNVLSDHKGFILVYRPENLDILYFAEMELSSNLRFTNSEGYYVLNSISISDYEPKQTPKFSCTENKVIDEWEKEIKSSGAYYETFFDFEYQLISSEKKDEEMNIPICYATMDISYSKFKWNVTGKTGKLMLNECETQEERSGEINTIKYAVKTTPDAKAFFDATFPAQPGQETGLFSDDKVWYVMFANAFNCGIGNMNDPKAVLFFNSDDLHKAYFLMYNQEDKVVITLSEITINDDYCFWTEKELVKDNLIDKY